MKRKLSVFTFTLLLLLSSAGVFACDVKAEEYNTTQDEYGYNYSCGSQFEVDEITDDGNFEVKGCYLSLNDAKTKMQENEDYVVRYASSRSPMKIVAMNGGLVYGYPGRKNHSTIYVYENADETGITTYTGSYYEMVYEDTNVVVTSGNYAGYGILHVNLNGFDGYTDLELVDLIPFKFIDDEIPCYTGINSTYAKKFIIRQNYFVARQNGNYKDLCLNYAISVKHPNANDAKQSGEMSIGQAPAEMELDKYYYSKDGVTFYSDSHYQNYAFTNYNYFQWLSLRSEANVTKDQLNGYLSIKNKTNSAFYGDNAQAFINAQDTYGMNALLVFALACNESNYGTDMIKTNNIFGLGAYDGAENNAYEFASIEACINDFEGWHLAKYCDYYYESSGGYHYYMAPYFGNKGTGVSVRYMSDPYECYKVASIAYNFDKYINDYDGTYTNNNAYDLALVNENGVDFKVQASNDSKTLYQSYSGFYTTYQKDCVVTVLEQSDDYAKVISGNPIDENGNVVVTTGMTTYDHARSVAYVEISKLTALNNENMFTDPIGEYTLTIDELNWNENLLHIKGNAITENLDAAANVSLVLSNDISYEIVESQNEDSIVIEEELDLSTLATGTYTLNIQVEYADYSEYNQNRTFTVLDLPGRKVMNDKVYEFNFEDEKIILNVTEEPDEYKSLIVTRNIELKKNTENNHVELTVKGIGAISGIDSKNAGDTLHNLILENLNDGTEIVVALENTSSVFSINDGHVYTEAGFEKTIDVNELTDYPLGSYALKIETVIGDIHSFGYLRSSNSNFANLNTVSEDGNVSYRISLNDYELNRVELDIENHFSEIDYSLIKKVEERTSLTNVTKISFENEKLTINLAAMIYYLDYDKQEEIEYHVYLINDAEDKIIEMNTQFIENKYNYKKNFRSNYNMDNISISASKDLSDIEKGEYRIVVEIINQKDETAYHDYVNLIDSFNLQRDSTTYNSLEYSFYVSNVRDRMILKVSE